MSEGTHGPVRYEAADGVAWITVDRPAKLNALDRTTVGALAAAAGRAIEDPAVGVLVVTGAGDKAFVAGADIAEMASLDPREAQAFSRFLQESFDRLERSPKPVIAMVNGFALGGGCELAMACHVRFASETARFGQPEVNLGLIPGAGGTQRLQRLVGRGRALDLILGGHVIEAAEAHRIGLADRVVAPDRLRGAVEEFAAQLRGKSPSALARALDAVLSGGEMALGEALHHEAALFGLCFATADMREGTSAFLEKRKARFPGK